MSKRPSPIYRDEEPGRHISIYAGRNLMGFVVVRDDEAHAYGAQGGFVGTFAADKEGLSAAREWLLSDQGER